MIKHILLAIVQTVVTVMLVLFAVDTVYEQVYRNFASKYDAILIAAPDVRYMEEQDKKKSPKIRDDYKGVNKNVK